MAGSPDRFRTPFNGFKEPKQILMSLIIERATSPQVPKRLDLRVGDEHAKLRQAPKGLLCDAVGSAPSFSDQYAVGEACIVQYCTKGSRAARVRGHGGRENPFLL